MTKLKIEAKVRNVALDSTINSVWKFVQHNVQSSVLYSVRGSIWRFVRKSVRNSVKIHNEIRAKLND